MALGQTAPGASSSNVLDRPRTCASSSPASPDTSAARSCRGCRRDGHELVGLARDPVARVDADVPLVRGDVLTGAGLDEALEGTDVAYYLIHSMERGERTARSPRARSEGAQQLRRGGRALRRRPGRLPRRHPARPAPISPHMASRLRVEELLLEAVPGLGRAARVDRHRRALALVPLPRAPRRARARSIPMPPWRASRTAADRRPRRARVPRRARRPSRGAAGGARSTSPGPTS